MEEFSDPAAVFACAKSLYEACLERENADPDLNLSRIYQGMDSFMREVMRVSAMFEDWACLHVAFHELEEVWTYFLEDQFGSACLDTMRADALTGFDRDDCLRVALRLRLPLLADGSLPLPLCIEAPNPLARAAFKKLRIQTVRRELYKEGGMFPFTEADDPFNKNFGPPIYGIYGVGADDLLDHISDCESYASARKLLAKLLPGIGFPEEMTVFSLVQFLPLQHAKD